MVRTRPAGDRAKLPPDGAGEETVHTPAPAADAAEAPSSNNVEKCVNCQFYDRRRARPTDGKAPMWGQCRRHSPHLNPFTAKAYFVEGVWPLVRDDDWCGEWKILTRMPEEPLPETTALAAEDAPAPAPAHGRAAPAATAPAVAND